MICHYKGCSKRSSYGYEDRQPTHCAEHKLSNMRDVVHICCGHNGCYKQARYGLEYKKATHCLIHALKNMRNVINKQCVYAGCYTIPIFGLEDKMPTHCKEHMLKNMRDVIHKCCKVEGCNTISNFGLEDKKATHCKEHATGNMRNVKDKKCILCNLTRSNPKYKGYCAPCCLFKYPDDPRVRNYKTKEQAIMSAILKKYPDMILDKAILGGCSRKRPDGLLDLGSHVIIIEVDENQHRGYDKSCDNKRIMMLSQDLAHRPIVFIRVNPDSFKCEGKRVDGAFKLSKTGVLSAKPNVLQTRIDAVLQAMAVYMTVVPDPTVTIENLFFDC